MKRRNNQTERYAIYARCSTDDQAFRDFSTIDVQQSANSQHVQEKGKSLVKDYADEGISGTHLRRKGFQQMLLDAQAGLFDIVVCTYMSRLGRGKAFDNAEYELGKYGVRVEMVKEHFTDDLNGYIQQRMTVVMDGMFPLQVAQWTKTKMEAMAKAGYVCGGATPFGMSKEYVEGVGPNSRNDNEPPKRYTPHPEEAAIVLRAFELFAETHSLVNVQTYLKAMSNRTWSFDAVTRLLRNEVYRGVIVFGNWRNDNAHEAIVSPELWEAVRAADENRSRRRKQNPKDVYPYYLRGVVHCPHCGCKMTPAAHPGRTATVTYYECIHSFKKVTQSCPVRRVNAGTLHNAVFGEIRRAAEHPTRMTELIREAAKRLPQQESLPSDLAAVNKRMKDIDKQLGNLAQAVALGGGQLRPLLQKMDTLETSRLPLERKQRELEEAVEVSRRNRPNADRICREWSRVTELWEGANDEEREELMQAMVIRVEMDQKEEGTCEVALLPQVPSLASDWLGLTSRMGAGVGLEPTTFGL